MGPPPGGRAHPVARPPQVILSVAGGRRTVLSMVSVARALVHGEHVRHVMVHLGQHAADTVHASLPDLHPPLPSYHLDAGTGSHSQVTATAMQRLEPVYQNVRPDLVLVYGNDDATLAATLVAAKLEIPVGHVEAGLRSRDCSMPEEVNRVLTDRVAQLLFAPSRDAVDNLLLEGTAPGRIAFVGNVMIDTVVAALPHALQVDLPAAFDVTRGSYAVVTLQQPANVEDPDTLRELGEALRLLSRDLPVLIPASPATRSRLCQAAGEWLEAPGTSVRVLDPLPYVDMLALVMSAALVITDSGGLQDETTYLGVPCLTVRPNTERPVTCLVGTNRLVPPLRDPIVAAARESRARPVRGPTRIPGWDGRAAERIAALVLGEAALPPSPYDLTPVRRSAWEAA